MHKKAKEYRDHWKEEWFRKNQRSLYQELNELLDRFVGRFQQDKEMFDKYGDEELKDFPTFVFERNVPDKRVDLGRIYRCIRWLRERDHWDLFAYHWAFYRMWASLVREKQNYEEGHSRDLYHGSYVDYVDALSMDGSMCARARSAWPKVWSNKLLSNKDLQKTI